VRVTRRIRGDTWGRVEARRGMVMQRRGNRLVEVGAVCRWSEDSTENGPRDRVKRIEYDERKRLCVSS